MSTKIYTGFKVAHNNPVLLQKQLKNLQVEYTNNSKYFLSGVLRNPLNYISKEKDQEDKDQIEFWYKEKLTADVVIYFKKDKLIGTYFIHDRELEKKFRKQRWFRDYHYQDQSDPDPRVSAKEWKQREKDWAFLDVPSNDGFLFSLVHLKDIQPFWINWYRFEQKRKREGTLKELAKDAQENNMGY